MAAIGTDPLKQKFIDLLFDEVSSSNDSDEYFLGIGKSDTYDATDTVATPLRNTKEEREARANLQAIKKVTGTSFVVPRYNWTSGTIYSAWADSHVGIPTNVYYVLTEDNEVYICLQQGKDATGQTNASTVKPSFTAAGVTETKAFQTADGYRWKLLYALSAARASTFLSAQFIPAQDVDSAALPTPNAFETQQLNIKSSATPGQILGIEIVNAGTGYSSAPTLTINGNGSGASATATIVGGSIAKIEMLNESGGMGQGYDYASVSTTGNAVLRPIIGPRDGIGRSVINDLKSSSVMFNVKTAGAEGGEFNTTNDFRQILMLKNLELTDSASAGPRYKGVASKVGRFLTLQSSIATSGLSVDDTITGGTTGFTATISELDSSTGNRVFFQQNLNNVAGNFQDGEALTGSPSGGSGLVDSGNKNNIIDQYSGDVLYIENRARVIRASTQTEDIKVIITV